MATATSKLYQEFFSAQEGKRICSIFPVQCRAERAFNGKTIYILPASESQDDIQSFMVGNAFEHVYVGNRRWNDQPVFSEDIANDILREFTSGLSGMESGLGPGIWICEGKAPTPEEIQAARARQVGYFEYLINQANSLDVSGKGNDITDLHRAAARWMGYESAGWINKMTQKSLKDCPACYTKVDSRATICPNCRTQIGAAVPAAQALKEKGK